MTLQPTVLLVEDEPAQREVLTYNLQAEGFRTLTAPDGEAALLVIAETPPDVIVLDWMMPHLSGIELCRRLKQRPRRGPSRSSCCRPAAKRWTASAVLIPGR
jgi:two-component system, OmpR family, phosphate regulon response regulator PhoB